MTSLHSANTQEQERPAKPPKQIFENRFAFPPNRETLGGTSYFIVGNSANILIDCPAWNSTNREFLDAQGGVQFLVLSHRGAIANVREIHRAFNCEILIQEQEAYLLPHLSLTSFQHEFTFSDEEMRLLWTPGHSPGSSCLYDRAFGGILFTGRHLLPNGQGSPTPLRTSKTFHWWRQLASVQRILDEYTPETLEYICPGANSGLLRGKGAMSAAYARLAQLDLRSLKEE